MSTSAKQSAILCAALSLSMCCVLVTKPHAAPNQGRLDCELGSSTRWGSSWCNLKPPADFSGGSTVEINIDPDGAKVVLVRFLSSGNDPNEPLGIIGGKRPVPADGKVVIKLDHDYKNIGQISVHGGPGPWDYNLGRDNKGAVIQSISVHQ